MSDTICTGSHLHRRTFPEDDYWPSFQSTIQAGQVMSAEETINNNATFCNAAGETVTLASLHDQTTNVADLSSLVEDEVREDPWNMNIDAIGSPELPEDFYDCPSFEKSPPNLMRSTNRVFNVIYSPRAYSLPQFFRVQFASPPDDANDDDNQRKVQFASLPDANDDNNNNNNKSKVGGEYPASPRKPAATARRISPKLTISHASNASSSPGLAMKTGSYLVQMIDDFKGLEDHAQSTPKLSSDSGNPSSGNSIFIAEPSRVDSLRKNLDAEFQNAETAVVASPSISQQADVSVSNKENFYGGKYSSFVAIRRAFEAKKPSPQKFHTRSGKVALLKEYFQARVNDSIQLYKSRIPVPIRGRVKKSPQAKTRAHGSPSFQCRKSYKLVSSRSSSIGSGSSRIHPSTATSFSSSGCDSFLTRNQHKTSSSRTSRVQSCSDATNAVELTSIDESCKSHSTGDLASGNSSASMKVLNSSKITKRNYNLKPEESSALLSPKRVSAINKRRSVGLQLKKNASPVKPVCELRKLFTPSKRARRNSGSQCSFNVTRKQASHLVVPKIVITHL